MPAGLFRLWLGWAGSTGLFRMYNLTIFGELTSRGSWIVVDGSCSRLTGHFGVHSWSCTKLYNLMHGWEGLLPGPSEAGSISVAQTEVDESAIQLLVRLPSPNSSPQSWTALGFHGLLPGFQHSHEGTFVYGWMLKCCC